MFGSVFYEASHRPSSRSRVVRSDAVAIEGQVSTRTRSSEANVHEGHQEDTRWHC